MTVERISGIGWGFTILVNPDFVEAIRLRPDVFGELTDHSPGALEVEEALQTSSLANGAVTILLSLDQWCGAFPNTIVVLAKSGQVDIPDRGEMSIGPVVLSASTIPQCEAELQEAKKAFAEAGIATSDTGFVYWEAIL